VVGPEEIRSEFVDALAQDTRTALLGWAAVDAHATPAQVLDAISPLLEEAELLERWRGLAARGERATAGWADTLDALSDARVEVLLVAEGGNRSVWECPACGRAATASGECPLDGIALDERDNGVDAAVHRALAHGSRVHVVRHHDDLGPAEGIGALLRY